jgi:hypothetical protein
MSGNFVGWLKDAEESGLLTWLEIDVCLKQVKESLTWSIDKDKNKAWEAIDRLENILAELFEEARRGK